MISSIFINKQKVSAIFIAILSVLLLQACGGQRDTPFDPGTSTSSHGAVVDIEKLINGDGATRDIADEGSLVKITDPANFATSWKKYTDEVQGSPDFTVGQVLLIDLGKKRACDRKLTLSQVAAYVGTANSVLVVLDYSDPDQSSNSSNSSSRSSVSSSSSSNSSCGDTTTTRPFYFYYIKSRAELIIEENVP